MASRVIVDYGNEFLAKFKNIIQANYNIKVRPSITSWGQQPNLILERIHLTIGNTQYIVFDDENPWDGILASTIYVLHATVQHSIS